MGYWKSTVLPKIKKVFENKNALKKAAAAEAAKSFEDSKVEIDREFEVKRTELQPKVLELYEAAPAEIKTMVKERTDAGVKKNPAAVTKFLEELSKIEFPGAKKVSEIAASYGPALVPAPVLLLLEKVSTFLPAEETPAPAAESEAAAAAAAVEESSSSKEKELIVEAEETKKEEAAAEPEAAPPAKEKVPEATEAPAVELAATTPAEEAPKA